MNLATKITIFRLFMAPVGVTLLFLTQIPNNYAWATAVFLIALASDIVDGQIARRRDMVTTLGGCLDSMADKLLVLTYFVYLQSMGLYPLWLLELVLGRMIIVNGVRSYMISYKPNVGTLIAGKWQGLLIILSLVIGLLSICVASGQLPGVGDAFTLRTWAYYTMLAGFFLSLIISPHDFIENTKALFASRKQHVE